MPSLSDAEPTVPLAHFSAALDEIYALRQALAHEALTLQVHASYATFPKSRRANAADQVQRMSDAARGNVKAAYQGVSWTYRKHALREVGASETLTASEWLKTLPASLRPSRKD